MVKRLVLNAIKVFQWTRVLRKPACRFYPSCSDYTADAVNKHGTIKGLTLGLFRLLHCHPFHPGGVDFVPESFEWRVSCLCPTHPNKI